MEVCIHADRVFCGGANSCSGSATAWSEKRHRADAFALVWTYDVDVPNQSATRRPVGFLLTETDYHG